MFFSTIRCKKLLKNFPGKMKLNVGKGFNIWGKWRRKMKKIRIFLTFISITIISIVVNGIIHEAGHGLFVLLFGGEINYIQPLIFLGSPHISYSDLSVLGFWERALVIIGGTLLPVKLGLLGILMVPIRNFKPVVGISLAVLIFSFASQTLAWIFLPVLYFFRGGFQGDDVVAFIQHTGFHPFWVSFFAFLIFSLIFILFFRRIPFFVLAKRLRTGEDVKWKPYRGEFPGNFSFAIWVFLLLAITSFSLAQMNTIGLAENRVSFYIETMDREVILEKIVLEDDETKTLIFNYFFQAERAKFNLVLINPKEEMVREESHAGFNMKIRSGNIEVPIYGPGEWIFKISGSAENLEFDLSYFIE